MKKLMGTIEISSLHYFAVSKILRFGDIVGWYLTYYHQVESMCQNLNKSAC